MKSIKYFSLSCHENMVDIFNVSNFFLNQVGSLKFENIVQALCLKN